MHVGTLPTGEKATCNASNMCGHHFLQTVQNMDFQSRWIHVMFMSGVHGETVCGHTSHKILIMNTYIQAHGSWFIKVDTIYSDGLQGLTHFTSRTC